MTSRRRTRHGKCEHLKERSNTNKKKLNGDGKTISGLVISDTSHAGNMTATSMGIFGHVE